MLRYLKSWTPQRRWQRLPAFEKLAHMLIDHVDGILNRCRIKVGVVEAEKKKWPSRRILALSPFLRHFYKHFTNAAHAIASPGRDSDCEYR